MMKGKNRGRMYPTRRRNSVCLSMLVLIPVLIVSVVNFCILYANTVSTIQNDLRAESYRAMEIFNTHLNSMSNIVGTRRSDKSFSTEAQVKISTAYYPIVQQLRKDTLWMPFFNGVYYYSLQSDIVYQANCAVAAEEFFSLKGGKPLYYPVNTMQMQQQDEQSLGEPGNHTRAFRVRHVDQHHDGVLLAVPLELQTDAPPLSYMLFTISDNMLGNLMNDGNNAVCILAYNGTPVYSSDPEIRQSIYDGKELPQIFLSRETQTFHQDSLQISWHIRKDYIMQKLLPTVLLQAAVTFSVVVVGLLLLLYVSRKTYEPVRNLLRKLPTRSDTESFTDEFHYIDYVLDDLMLSRHYYEESVKELRREKYLFYILDNQVEPEKTLYRQCLNEGIRVDRTYFACILMEDTAQNYEMYAWLTAQDTNPEKKADVYSLYIGENKYLFLLATDLPEPDFAAYLSELSGTDTALVKTSDIIKGVHRVRQAYAAVSRSNPYGETREGASKAPFMELQLLREAAETDNTDKVEFALRMIKCDIVKYDEFSRLSVLGAVYRILSGISPQSYETVPPSADEEASIALLDIWLTQFVTANEAAEPAEKGLPRNLHTIVQYIEENYTSPTFSIKYMAADFGTSPSNLSHQFKKLTGQTLSRFIDELRIAKAEELLAAGDKIHIVAQKLGYSTAPVFTEAYKRMRGITPRTYRDQYQKSEYGNPS